MPVQGERGMGEHRHHWCGRRTGACSHSESLCFHGEADLRGWRESNSVSVLTSLKMAAEQEIVTGKRFFYIMRSNYESLSTGEVARTVTRYQRIRAHLPDTP